MSNIIKLATFFWIGLGAIACGDDGTDNVVVQCTPDEPCSARCEAGQMCDFHCNGASSCNFDCKEGDCLVTGNRVDGVRLGDGVCQCSGDCNPSCGDRYEPQTNDDDACFDTCYLCFHCAF